jgi:hypothetical protein
VPFWLVTLPLASHFIFNTPQGYAKGVLIHSSTVARSV